MNHLSDEQLTLLYYGEESADAHLEQCLECHERYDSLRRALGAVEMPVLDRGLGYGSEVWGRIESRLESRIAAPRRKPILRWALPIAAAVVFVAGGAFEAGRVYQSRHLPASATEAAAFQQGTAERILLVAVADYLERSQIVLIGLANADPDEALDISSEQQRVRDLVAENRLYRQTAESTGQAGIASLLDDLERVLLEIEHSPSQMPPEELKELRHRLKDDGMLFKMHVMGTNVEKL